MCVITTIGKSIQVLYVGRLEYLLRNGFEITVGCAASSDDAAIRDRGVRLKTFPLTRAITPLQDLRALVQLYRFLRTERFDLVEVATPKAALLGSLAAWLARCPTIIHILHGTAYEGKRNALGALLRLASSLPCRLSHVTFAVSPSVAARICADGLGSPDRIRVIGAGSANGVDVQRFAPVETASRRAVRERYGIGTDAVVIGFIGRLTRDKGVEELATAFVAAHDRWPHIVLLLVGDYEARDRPSHDAVDTLAHHPAVRHVGWQDDVVPFMAAMNILVLPTYREGLGNVLLEAAAMGLPTITTDATGARDAILHRHTGLRVPVADSAALTEAICELVPDPSLRQRMGDAGRKWVCEHFEQRSVWQKHADVYRDLASGTGDALSDSEMDPH